MPVPMLKVEIICTYLIFFSNARKGCLLVYNLMNVHNIQVACELNSTFIDKSLPSLQH